MTALLTTWSTAMERYRDEGEWTYPCTEAMDFGFLAAAALFGGLGIALLIFYSERLIRCLELIA